MRYRGAVCRCSGGVAPYPALRNITLCRSRLNLQSGTRALQQPEHFGAPFHHEVGQRIQRLRQPKDGRALCCRHSNRQIKSGATNTGFRLLLTAPYLVKDFRGLCVPRARTQSVLTVHERLTKEKQIPRNHDRVAVLGLVKRAA